MKSFIEFIRKQGVVGFATGFILGGAVSGLVSSFVTNIINPIIGVVIGKTQGLTSAILTVGTVQIKWGAFLATLIDFIVVAFTVYALVHYLKLDKLDLKKDDKK